MCGRVNIEGPALAEALTAAWPEAANWPLAELYGHAQINVAPQARVSVLGQGAEAAGIRVAAARGHALDGHEPQQMRSPIVAGSDLILVMDDGHLERLLKRYPEARGKAFKLGKWLGDKDIVDPYLRDDDFFRLVFDEIDRAVEAWLPHLKA